MPAARRPPVNLVTASLTRYDDDDNDDLDYDDFDNDNDDNGNDDDDLTPHLETQNLNRFLVCRK